VRWFYGEARDAVGPTPEQGRGSEVVPAKSVGQANSKLGQSLPKVAFGIRSCLPGSLQDLVGVKGQTFVQ
jgi:hypothetical protein